MSVEAAAPPSTEFRIDPATWPGHVHLTVSNLATELAFYQKAIGLQLHWRRAGSAGLGAGGDDLLRLTENGAARRPRGTTGMYHFAILLPNRRELARAIARLFALRWPNSPTDHIMTKTTYLDDPEGNNIELYTESPEDGVMGFEAGAPFARRADGTPRISPVIHPPCPRSSSTAINSLTPNASAIGRVTNSLVAVMMRT